MAAEHDTEVQVADAGASLTYPVQAGSLKKGMLVLIKNRPCKIVEFLDVHNSKHGHAKTHMVALDIFSGRKYEDVNPSHAMVDAPVCQRQVFNLIDADDQEGTCSLMDGKGEIHDEFNLPACPDMRRQMVDAMRRGQELTVVVVSAMGESRVLEARKGKG
eukprot:TRINITY_DN3722_c0_g1_i1.p1 TRINITY_DN3722_c0_g1~~TRINITY_DN3722_c0_g1_i1.p1  ORF type:complete len:181 (+),score=72.47 TRINITY_DN3722_c0_g1_i1:65-544(+)